jgi:hypothetical protein
MPAEPEDSWQRASTKALDSVDDDRVVPEKTQCQEDQQDSEGDADPESNPLTF